MATGITELIANFTEIFSGMISGVFQPLYDFIVLDSNELLLVPLALMLIVMGVGVVRRLFRGV